MTTKWRNPTPGPGAMQKSGASVEPDPHLWGKEHVASHPGNSKGNAKHNLHLQAHPHNASQAPPGPASTAIDCPMSVVDPAGQPAKRSSTLHQDPQAPPVPPYTSQRDPQSLCIWQRNLSWQTHGKLPNFPHQAVPDARKP